MAGAALELPAGKGRDVMPPVEPVLYAKFTPGFLLPWLMVVFVKQVPAPKPPVYAKPTHWGRPSHRAKHSS